jgi:SAM-dependent methyltransferase
MTQIYKQHMWGGKEVDFYSGEGSHDPYLVEPYVEVVSTFLNSFESPLSVVDLGCGDFNVGKRLIAFTEYYVAVDIVPELIERNKKVFIDERLEFRCLDLATGELPFGDVALLRNVLQHLSNGEIQAIVPKLAQYKYVLLTEHIPDGDFIPNVNIISGQGIRLKKQSGVDLMAPPFNFQVKDTYQILTVPFKENKGKVVSRLYRGIL